EQRRWAEAEPLLREGLAIWDAKRPDDWSRFNAQSRLGGSLLGQKRYAEAEPLLLSGSEGLKTRGERVPARSKKRLAEAGVRGGQLYEAWGKAHEPREWRGERPARS